MITSSREKVYSRFIISRTLWGEQQRAALLGFTVVLPGYTSCMTASMD